MLAKEEYIKTVKRPYPPFFASLICRGYPDSAVFKGLLKKKYCVSHLIQVNRIWYYTKKDVEGGAKLTFESWKDPKLLAFAKTELEKRENALVASATQSFEKFCDAWAQYMPSVMLIFIVDSLIDKTLRETLAKKMPAADVDSLMHELNTPEKDNIHKIEEYELMTASSLSDHVKKYEWLYARYGDDRAYTIADAEEKLAHIDKKEFLRKSEQDKKRLSAALEKTMKLLEKDSWMLDFFQYVVYYRTQRTDIMNKAAYLALPMLRARAKLESLSYNQFLLCTVEELLLRKIPPRGVLDKRAFDYGVIMDGPDVCCVVDAELDKLKYFFNEEQLNVESFKGSVACKGKVTAPAKLILSNRDFGKIERGDIIITSMTTPDMVPIMLKAGGFVTDEGGVTCHAAIISREMGKSCLIGTRNATKIVRDGDLIEIDALAGVVRVLKRSGA